MGDDGSAELSRYVKLLRVVTIVLLRVPFTGRTSTDPLECSHHYSTSDYNTGSFLKFVT